MSEPEQQVECPQHGVRDATFVCRHLMKGRGLGFNQGFDEEDPDAVFPNAWCDSCEAVRREAGGWTESAETLATIVLICSSCYLKQRLLNWPRSTHPEQEDLIRQSLEYLQERQDALARQYRISDHERYDWDQGSRELVFSNRGVPAIVADFQFVGSISTRTSTWLWSWANRSDLERTRSRVRQVRAYGDEHRLLKLACAYWTAEEEDGWEMAAVAAYLLKAKGVYRSPDDHRYSFLLLTDVRWAQ
jgi:hypothetical protein